MKRNQLRICLVAIMMAGLILLSLSAASNQSTLAGQGKGGEVIAKPTPTPKKTTTTKKNQPAKSTSNSKTSRPAKTPSDSATTAEMIFWNTIKDSTNPDDFKEYLKKYPNGEFAGLARNRLNALETAAKEEAARKEEARRKDEDAAKKRPGAVVKNSIGMELVYIPPGSFMMGSTNVELDEKPVHQVKINYSLYMGKYEVTQAQWQSVMGSNPSYFKDCGGNCPVERVSWDSAQNFINKLNESNDGFRYRLPTESEWEYACRAGTTGDYAGNLSEMAWYSDNSGHKTHAVGGKRPNDWGLADMHGNVMEWCQDWYHETYDGAPTDGRAWLSGGGQKYRVLRGGAWTVIAYYSRSTTRHRRVPEDRSMDHGFRVVAVPRTQ
jgi:formylglycine-generating enzyme required for sulfatase activity